MKNTIYTALLLVMLIGVTSISSCKKKESDPPRRELITGTWKMTQMGTDVNGNGAWDQDEVGSVPSTYALTLIFNTDGTGTGLINYMGFPVSGNMTWELANADNDLKVTLTVVGMPLITLNYTFTSFTRSEIKVKDNSSPLKFNTFQKQ